MKDTQKPESNTIKLEDGSTLNVYGEYYQPGDTIYLYGRTKVSFFKNPIAWFKQLFRKRKFKILSINENEAKRQS